MKLMIKKNDNLKKWLQEKLPIVGDLKKIEKFEIGQSNPTYLLHCENKKLVLRSKPMGNLLRGAHRIDREYKVMNALKETKIPVPNMITYCEENNIIGSEFYLMDFIDGIKEKNPILENYSKHEKKKIYTKKLEVLINLARLDLKKFNLEDYGKKADYLSRQIDLWIKQYRSSETKKIEAMEFLIENLEPNIPKMYQKFNVVLTHGDFRIDNIIFSKDLDIASLLDWELSTLAPPFIDLSYWCLMLRFESNWLIPGLGMTRDDVLTAGIPEEKDLLQLYKDALGYDIGKSWNFLLAFNCFRFAGILQGVYKRSKDGNNAGKDANSVGLLTEPVSKMGEKLLKLYL
tara:strand:+ start:1439 stop:2473 length:1035 start_codon:yes stop_codon:yes gene_type:complete